jgi:hypothetical protein
MTEAAAERLVKLVLRLGGVLLGAALVAVFLPFETMARIHRDWLGMGELPDRPIVDYLARSLSLFYAAQAPLHFMAAADLRRLRPLALYLGWFHLVLGAALVVVDLHAGMTAFWIWNEGPPAVAVGALILLLLRRIEPARAP